MQADRSDGPPRSQDAQIQELLLEKALSDKIIECLPGYFYLHDEQGRRLRWSKQTQEALGLTAEQMRAAPMSHGIFGEDLPLVMENVEHLFATGEALPTEFRITDAEGEVRHIYGTGARLEFDGRRYLVGVALDVTARKQAEMELRRALAEIERLQEQLEAENLHLREELDTLRGPGSLIAESPAMKAVMTQVAQVAQTDATVLIQGETGTGKELVAKAIHSLGQRRDRPLVVVNCAAMPDTLVESELFGREKGAYTGALTRQRGRFEIADRSTIFLDEIGELDAGSQAKLLRVLQEGELERLGSSRTIKVDVRIIAATNRDLEREVAEGRFRQDLFYRLSVFPLQLPPLRQRREEIPLLVWAFVKELSEKMGKKIDRIPRQTMEALSRGRWPGNVRELRNVIERAMICSSGTLLQVELPSEAVSAPMVDRPATLKEVERRHILEVLEATGWRVRGAGGAAELLDLKPSTLESRMTRLEIRRPGKPQ